MADSPANTESGVSLLGCAFGALAVAWCVWLVGLAYGHSIAARFAPPTEVSDSLAQAGYIGARLLPFDCVAVVADFVSLVLSGLALEAARTGGFRILAVGVLAGLSICVHGLALLIHFIVAG